MSQETLQFTFTLIGVIGLAITGLSIFYNNWRTGSIGIRTNVINALKDLLATNEKTIQNKEATINELQTQNKELIAESAKCKATIIEKDKQIADLTALLTGRDPNTLLFQKEGLDAIRRAEKSFKLLQKIATTLKVRNGINKRKKPKETAQS